MIHWEWMVAAAAGMVLLGVLADLIARMRRTAAARRAEPEEALVSPDPLAELLEPLAKTWKMDPALTPEETDRSKVSGHPPIPPVIGFYLMPEEPGLAFDGPFVVESLRRLGLVYGEKKIFDARDPDTDSIWFSVASAFEPGTFNLNQLGPWEVKGLILFMALPGPDRPLLAFEQMLDTAKKLAALLQAVVCDWEDHLLLGVDKVLEYRQQIRHFEQQAFQSAAAPKLHPHNGSEL